MILKMKRLDKNQDWWIFDNIRKISIGKEYSESVEQVCEYLDMCNPDIILLDHMYQPNQDSNKHNYMTLICKERNDNEFSIVFDTMAYLCNDEGKTVEKIVVNNIPEGTLTTGKKAVKPSEKAHK